MKIPKITTWLSLLFAVASLLLVAGIGKRYGKDILNNNLGLAQGIINTAKTQDSCKEHDHAKEQGDDHTKKQEHDHAKEQGDDHAKEQGDDHAKEQGDDHDYPDGTVLLSAVQQQEGGLQIAAAEAGVLNEVLEMIGEVSIEPTRTAHVVAQVPGFVRSLAVKKGDLVRAGQELLTLFSPELAELKCDYLEKQRSLVLARQTFARKELLKKENIGLEADWQEAKFSLANALSAQQFSAQRLLALGLQGYSLEDLESQSPSNYGLYQVIAPVDGVVLEQMVALGSRVENENLLVIADLQEVRADFQVSTRHLNSLQVGQSVMVVALDGPATAGVISLLTPIVNAATQNATVWVTIPNPDGQWRPGLFVRGEVSLPGQRTALLAPADAILELDNQQVVFVHLGGEAFAARNIQRGRQSGGMVEIISGLAVGEKIVLAGAFTLKAVKETSGMDSHAGHGH